MLNEPLKAINFGRTKIVMRQKDRAISQDEDRSKKSGTNKSNKHSRKRSKPQKEQ